MLLRPATASLRSALVLLSMLILSTATAPAGAQTPISEVLPALYARYLSGGRSDVEIHLSPSGPYASASLRSHADGTFSCHVSGLQPLGTALDTAAGHLQLAGLLVHEATHCLVGPYIGDLRHHSTEADDPISIAVDHLLLLSAESISDARAVIEVFRSDGAEAAQTLAALMLPQRLNAKTFGHSTAPALQAALAWTKQHPQSPTSPAEAFAEALHIGRSSALQTLKNTLQAAGQQEWLQTRAFNDVVTAQDAALARSLQAFNSGRYANNAATLRESSDGVSRADFHFFVAGEGSVRTAAVVSAEGAHSSADLTFMLQADDSPEHRLAVQWLLREGRLDTHNLGPSRAIFARFMRAMGNGSAARQARAAQVLGEVMMDRRPGEGMSSMLDDAADRLNAALQPG